MCNRLVVQALHVLQPEFPSRNIGTDLFDHTMMVIRASAIQRFSAGFGR
jgi:hypothetical protein